MIRIVGNTIDVGRPQDEDMTHAKPYRIMKSDPRPKCAIVVGDGFTQGYLHHYGLRQEIPCGMGSLIPGSLKIPYLPIKNDQFQDDVFFTAEKWPKIYAAFEGGLNGFDFFQQVSKDDINPHYKNGLWTLNNDTIGYELRCYLWHYFRSAHNKLIELKTNNFKMDFGWYPIFKFLLEEYFCQLISFNYDCVASIAMAESARLYPEDHQKWALGPVMKFPVEMPYDYYMNYYKLGEVPVVYIHGSWVSQIHFPFPNLVNPQTGQLPDNFSYDGNYISGGMLYPMTGFTENPWLRKELEFRQNYFSSVASRVEMDPQSFPMFPDIVPPGFQGQDKYNPYSKAPETSRRILNDADLVIVCGLSGNEPDTAEVEDLLSHIKKHVRVLHVGLSQDRSTPVANKLRSLGGWNFFDATTDLPHVMDYLLANRF